VGRAPLFEAVKGLPGAEALAQISLFIRTPSIWSRRPWVDKCPASGRSAKRCTRATARVPIGARTECYPAGTPGDAGLPAGL